MACFGPIPEDELKCANCESDDLQVNRDGDLTCCSCGEVCKERRIDMGLEVRTFDDDDAEQVRVERAGTISDSNALGSTGISNIKNPKANVGALRRAAANTEDKRDQKLLEMSRRLRDLSERVGVNDGVYRQAWTIFRDFDEKANYKEVEEVMLATIYIACRLEPGHALLQYKDLTKYASKPTTPSQLSGRVDHIKTTLKLRLDAQSVNGANLVMRFGTMLQMEHPVKQLALNIANLMSSVSVLQGKNPKTTAAVALWMASRVLGEAHSVNDICRECDVAAATLRKNWQEMYPSRLDVLPPEYQEKGKQLPDRIF